MTLSRLEQLLIQAADLEASDLHLTVGVPPAYRINGDIILADSGPLSKEGVTGMAYSLLNSEQREKFEREWELCFSFPHPDLGRIRVTLYRRNAAPEMSIRFCGKRLLSARPQTHGFLG